MKIILLLLLSGHCFAQIATINIPVRDALKVLAAADSFKISKIHINLLRNDIDLLNQRVIALQVSRDQYKLADSLCLNEISLANKQMDVLLDQKKIAAGYIAALEKLNKKQKRKTRLVAVAGIITTVAGIILIK